VLTVHPVSSEPAIRLGAVVPLTDPQVLSRIEDIWQEECKRQGPALFNGRMFSVERHDASTIIGAITEYKYFLAQRRDPWLRAELKVNPLAVSGITLCNDGVLFGRRGVRTEMDADRWELVPSGSVDTATMGHDGHASLRRSLLAELEEEVGISASEVVTPPRSIALVEDSQTHVIDVAMLVMVGLSGPEVLRRFAAIENREYSALEVIALNSIDEFRRALGTALIEVSAAILDVARPLLRKDLAEGSGLSDNTSPNHK
jgi:hypothetical protein